MKLQPATPYLSLALYNSGNKIYLPAPGYLLPCFFLTNVQYMQVDD